MQVTDRRLRREWLTMQKMVGIYCAAHHGHRDGDRCARGSEFLDYARVRLEKCPYGVTKPTCASCPVHCYKPAQREQARTIMRYAGPRMLLRHPILTLAHQLDGFRKARHPRELTRRERMSSRKS